MISQEPITAQVNGGLGKCYRYKDGVMDIERIPGCYDGSDEFVPIRKEAKKNWK